MTTYFTNSKYSQWGDRESQSERVRNKLGSPFFVQSQKEKKEKNREKSEWEFVKLGMS